MRLTTILLHLAACGMPLAGVEPLVAGGNAIPATMNASPDYFCTWNLQSWAARRRGAQPPLSADLQRDAIDEALLFSPAEGLANSGMTRSRGELFLLIDDGWDVPYGTSHVWKNSSHAKFGSMEPDPQRWPSSTGSGPQRLAALSAQVRAAGWRGLGLWVAANGKGDSGGWNADQVEAYWRARLISSAEAGIGYWKVDWGVYDKNHAYRALLTRLGRELAPTLVIEHAQPDGGLFRAANEITGRALLAFSDCYRTYDVLGGGLGLPTTLARCQQLLAAPAPTAPALGLINIESDPWIAAGLSCTLGLMAHTRTGWRGEDGVARLLRWRRLSPAFGVGGPMAVSSRMLSVSQAAPVGSYYEREAKRLKVPIVNGFVTQTAPAVIARGVALPTVEDPNGAAWVLASRHPQTGALAIAAAPRSGAPAGALPTAAIDVPAGTPAMAIFGNFAAVTLRLPSSRAGAVVLAQDLLGTACVDITAQIGTDMQAVRLDAALINSIGRSASAPGDSGMPGLVIVVSTAATGGNQAPIVNAGADATATLTATGNVALALDGSVSDDGKPLGKNLTIAWATTSGPGAVVFSAPTKADTQATFSVAGTYVLTLSANDGALTAGDQRRIVIAAAPATLPSPWQANSIGTGTGGTTHNAGTWTLTGRGADIWGSQDAFQFVSQPLTGDGTITARVASLSNTHAWAKAGVMIRGGLAANATHAMTVVTPRNGVAFQRRWSAGQMSAHTAGSRNGAPRWVRLTRAGNRITGAESADGVTWTDIGFADISMTDPVRVGLCVTSHQSSATATAVFTDVAIVPSGGG